MSSDAGSNPATSTNSLSDEVQQRTVTNERAAFIAAFLFLIVRQRFIKSIDIWGQLGATLGATALTMKGVAPNATN